MKLVYHADNIYDGLKPCPLCGKSVKMRGEGKAFRTVPGEALPVFNVRYLIQCKDCLIKLDVASKGFIDLTEDDDANEKKLYGLLDWRAEKVRERWNMREEEKE